ncbi:Uncharacterised protein [Segatella copri]|nr:Uncharacterised protein [Segatella copri]
MLRLLPWEQLISVPSRRSSSTHSPRKALAGRDSPERRRMSFSISDSVIFIYLSVISVIVSFCEIRGCTTV